MKNKKYLLVFLGLFLLVLVGMGVVIRGKLVGIQRENEGGIEESGEYFKKAVEESIETEYIEKTFISEDEKLFFTFTAKVVEGLDIQPSGLMRGKVIVDGDERNREITVWFSPTVEVYFGMFEGSFEGKSVWSRQSAEKVAKLVRPGTDVYLQVIHNYGAVEDEFKDYYYEMDKVLNELFVDIDDKKWEYQVPDNFVLSVDGLGVVL